MSKVLKDAGSFEKELNSVIENAKLADQEIEICNKRLEVLQPKYKELKSLLETLRVFVNITPEISPALTKS